MCREEKQEVEKCIRRVMVDDIRVSFNACLSQETLSWKTLVLVCSFTLAVDMIGDESRIYHGHVRGRWSR